LAQEVEEEIEKSGKFKGTVKVPIEPFQVFYPAEEYHQQFYVKNADQYHHYRKASGREAFIRSNWGEGETVDNY
jgi:peptide methionine sulfoxide reductase MsrA